MKGKLILAIILVLTILLISSCNKYEEVAYKKPYLTLDTNFMHKLKVKMYDYETKETINVKTYGFGDYFDGIYHQNNNDYLIPQILGCKLLIVHSNSESQIINPCKLAKIKNGSIESFALNDKYLVIKLDIKLKNEIDNYKYVLAVLNNNYQLVDYINIPSDIRGFNVFGDELIYNTTPDYDSDDTKGKTLTYDLKTKKLFVIEKNTKVKESFLKINDNLYSLDDSICQCNIYLNKKLLNNDNLPTSCYQDSIYNFRIQDDIIQPIFNNGSDNSEEGFLKYNIKNPKEITYLKDDICSNYSWTNSQGKYCKDKEMKNIYFNDFKSGYQKLDIDVNSGHQFAFFKW